MDRHDVLADDLPACVDAVGDGCTDARHGKVERGESPIREHEAMLFSASEVETDDVAARIDTSRAGL